MQTDHIDLYQIHWPARRTNFFGVRGYHHKEGWEDNVGMILKTLDEIKKEGKISHVGISNETPWGMMNYLKHSAVAPVPRIVSIQNPYSLLNRTFEVGLAEMAIREKTGLLAYSPMAFGMLSGKYHKGEAPKDGRITIFDRMSRYSGDTSRLATQQYVEIAAKHNLSLAQMSLAWVNQQPFLTSTIIGATNMEQLKENIDSINVKLDRDIIKEINAVHKQIPNPAP